jgi:excisionase family DNA binding protein
MDNETDLTPQQAAEMLQVDRSTISRWLKDKRIAAWRTPGGHWRIPEREVERIRNASQ